MKVKKSLILVVVLLALLSVGPVSLVGAVEPPYTCIDLEKTGPETAVPGETITYHFWVHNCGQLVLHGAAQVYDPLFGGEIWDQVLQPGASADIYKDYTVPKDYCGEFRNDAWAVGHPQRPDGGYEPEVRDDDSWTVDIICEPPPGTGTPGYWKNHLDAWPPEGIVIGGVPYTPDEAIAIMQTPEKGDKTYTLFRALVAAKLNVLVGNVSSCVDDTIGGADAWMATYGPVGNGVKAGGKDSAWRDAELMYQTLDAYNNGDLCAPSRDDLE